jgi:hypothetical protein
MAAKARPRMAERAHRERQGRAGRQLRACGEKRSSGERDVNRTGMASASNVALV